MAGQVCDTLTDLARTGKLDQVDSLLDDLWGTISDDSDTSRRRDAILTDIALQIAQARADICTDQTDADTVLREAVELTDRHLMFDSNLFEWAQIALDVGDDERAEHVLERHPLDTRLTRSDTSYGRNIPLETRYQYWRAAHRLHRRRHPDRADQALESVVPDDAEQDRAGGLPRLAGSARRLGCGIRCRNDGARRCTNRRTGRSERGRPRSSRTGRGTQAGT
jgi:hypothetical protein